MDSTRRFFIFVILGIFFKQVEGQCDDETRPLLINATYIPQYISSPLYPADYPLDANCAWTIKAPSPDDKITINLEEVGAEGSSLPCKYDYVAVYDGVDTSAEEIARLCNPNKEDVNSLVSTSDTLYVIFVSDWAFNYEGFNMLIFTNSTENMPDCTGNISLTASTHTQYIMSPNVPDVYESNFTCLIRIYPDTTYFAVRLDVVFMDIENTADCTNDVLRISSVGETDTVEAAAECSLAVDYEFTNFPLEVSGTYIEINFTTDASNEYLGFLLSYTEVFKGINLTSPLNGETVEISVPEDLSTGHVNESVCVIILTYTGTLDLEITPSYETTSDENVTMTDIQIFALEDTAPYLYLTLISSLDYEVINKFSLLVTMVDSDVTQVTYSVTFNVTITDVDDFAPEFSNLPGNYTVMRGQKTGELIYTVNATDSDGTEENRQTIYQIASGDTDSMFEINETSGEIILVQDANLIPLTTSEYDLTISAYSGSITKGSLVTDSTFTVIVSPDSPPECTHDTVWGETVDANLAELGTRVVLLDTWSCTDDNVNLTYSLESVSPNLTIQVFAIDSIGEVTLLRSFNKSEIENRQFALIIGVTDSVGQMVTFNMFMNVTALTCLPNPRNLYVRMDQEIGGVILNDFNCTNSYGLSYILKQYPAGTFEVDSATNGTAFLILKASVVKIKFYSLSITITDGVDIAVLEFNVIVQTRKCGIASESATLVIAHAWMFLNLLLFVMVGN